MHKDAKYQVFNMFAISQETTESWFLFFYMTMNRIIPFDGPGQTRSKYHNILAISHGKYEG